MGSNLTVTDEQRYLRLMVYCSIAHNSTLEFTTRCIRLSGLKVFFRSIPESQEECNLTALKGHLLGD